MNNIDVALLMPMTEENLLEYVRSQHMMRLYRNILVLGRAYDLRIGMVSTPQLRIEDGSAFTNALCWDGKRYVYTPTRLPGILENCTPISKHALSIIEPQIADWLRTQHYLNASIPGKKYLPEILIMQDLGQYTIPTLPVQDYSEILSTAALWKHCVIKPKNGKQGRAVSYLDMESDGLHFHDPETSCVLSEERWLQLCANWPQYDRYLMQPRLDFHLSDGHAVDFRLLVSRGLSGDWEAVAIYARIGASPIVSNVSHGGYVGDAMDILTHEYGESDAERLYSQLEELSVRVPAAVARYGRGIVSVLGIDVGIDRQTRQCYVIEVNAMPGVKYHSWQLAEKRIEYYRYCLQAPEFQ